MKLRNLMGAFLALAGVAFCGTAAAGDVWEFIPDSPTGTNYTAGTTVQFRMRVLTRNYEGPAGDLAPFMKTPNLDNYTVQAAYLADPVHAAETLNADYPLQIGVVANGKTVGAKLVTSNVTNDNLATDFVFAYTVQTGDYALPLRLAADANGNPINSGASTSKFFFLYGPGSGNEIWSIKATTRPEAGGETFTFDPQMVSQGTSETEVLPREVIPYNKDGDYLRTSFDFRLETLKFDELSTKGDDNKDYWRVVRGTKCQPAEPTMETVNGYLPLEGGRKVYAWVAPANGADGDLDGWSWGDESGYAVTIPSGANVETLTFTDPDGVAREHNVYVFTQAAGTPNYTFPLKGQTVGGTARIILSSSPHWNKIGSTGDWIATDFRVRTVYCGEQKPTLAVTLDGYATLATFPNGNHALVDYEKAERLRVTLDGKDSHAAFDVKLAFELGDKALYFPSNVIAISTDKDAGYVKNPLKDMTVHFAADATEATESKEGLYLFVLGATKETAVAPGITITPKIVGGGITIDATNSQYVVIRGMQPVVTKPVGTAEKPAQPDILIRGGGRKEVAVDLTDSYRNLHLSPAEASNGCYTVVWTPGNGQADQVVTNDVKGLPLVPDSYGQLKFYVSYPKNDATNLASFYVINPEGQKSYWLDDEGRQRADSYVRVIVARPATVTATAHCGSLVGDTFDEGQTVDFDFALDQPDLDPDRDLYAFLQPCNEAASNRCEATFITENKSGTKGTTGIRIWNQKGSTDDATGGLKLLDGPGNPQPKFKVVLCTEPTFDPDKVVTDFESQQFPIKVMNVAPVTSKFKQQGSNKNISKSGTTGDVVRVNSTCTFTPKEILDVSADLNATNENQVILRWRLYEIGEDGDENVDPYDIYYTIGTNVWTMPALEGGLKKVVVQAQDKDMRPVGKLVKDPGAPGGWRYQMDPDPDVTWWEDDENGWTPEEFVIYVPVNDKPKVEIRGTGGAEQLDGNEVFSESQLPGHEGRYIADDKMGFMVALSETSTKGPVKVVLELQYQGSQTTTYVGGNTWAATNGYVTIGVTNLTFNKTATATRPKEQKVKLTDFDGTCKNDMRRQGYASWRIVAKVISPSETYTDGACDFYVKNEAPEITSDLDNTDPSSAIEVAKNGTAIVTYALSDIDADLTNGMKVVCSVKGGEVVGEATHLATGGVSVATGEFTVRLTAVGTNTVTITATDKDFDSSSLKFYYAVEKTNDLLLYPAKPTSPSTDSDDIADYFSAAGIGYGRVWANNQLHGIQYWIQTWTSPSSSESVLAYAMGYKAGEQEQKGDANYPAFVDSTGGDTGATGYATPLKDLDSFFYRWFAKISSASSSDNSTWTSYKPVPQLSFDRNVVAAASVISIAFPSGADVKFNDISALAIFSREKMWSDNMGDINGDWVPDSYVMKYKLVTEYAGGADLKDVNFTEDGKTPLCQDYLPLTDAIRYSKLIPALTEYANIENAAAFTPRLKIRGYDDNLNDAVAEYLPNDDGTRTANPAFVDGAKPEKVYAMPDGSYNAASCTVSRVEHLAWKTFAAANLPEGAVSNKAYFSRWSPERPTDPTKADTDNDGITDGLEYYWWYRAHVGYLDGDVLRKATGRRYNPRNPGEGDFIPSAEIESIFDPLTPIADKKQDTDNDGLPDLLEFEIGTNPFDFDTDGDGLPDGFEIMLGGTDPLLAETTKGVSDAMRNFDGDAMAYTTPFYEKTYMAPTPLVTDPLYTFALVDEDGDTDGVQWYVGKTAPDPADLQPLETCVTGTSFTVGEKTYVTSGKVPVVDGRLAEDLGKAVTWEVLTCESLTNSIPSLTNLVGITGHIALMPTRIAAGTEVTGVTNATYATLQFAEDVTGVNAAWTYGRSVTAVTTGDSLANVGGFGMLAMGRYQDAPKGVRIAALPAEDENVAYLHHFVYQEFGFDPRTAWNANTPLAPRWGKTVGEGDSKEVVANNFTANYGYAGVSVRTREYTLYDEFLVMSFFLNNGKLSLADVTPTQAMPWEKIWAKYTTNGQGPNEPNWEEGNENYKGRTAETNSGENGADTDMDGVPDGWELYVMAGPKVYDKEKKAYFYNFAAPYNDGFFSAFGPFVGDAAKASTTDNTATGANEFAAGDGDGLTELQEYAGTDSCAYYCEPWGGNAAAFSATIVRPAEHEAWLNKFFPTDPWNKDTDGDGLGDSAEAGKFKYGKPVDDGKSCCIPGGGLNPCTVDTDRDGLPDGWEAQFAGKTVYSGPGLQRPKDRDGNEVADGNPLQGLCDGMDGTVFDAYSSPRINNAEETYTLTLNGVAQVVDRDYDKDGLENWQEYMTGAMRAWRYDDPVTDWSFIPDDLYWAKNADGAFVFSPDFAGLQARTGEIIDSYNTFLYKTFFDRSSKLYNPHFVSGTSPCSQYFTRVTNGFDQVFTEVGTYYMFYNRMNQDDLTETWGKAFYDVPMAPTKYICTSPIMADTDKDGMDDGYELFHGMNPILGKPGVLLDSDGPCDIVYDAWYVKPAGSPINALENVWMKKLPGSGDNAKYDFVAHPWLNGIVDVDPDGDDIRNQDEAIMPLVAPSMTWLHTDPTPLWMTDSTYSDSLVNRFFRLPIARGVVPVPESIDYKGKTYSLVDRDGYMVLPLIGPVIAPFVPDYWDLSATDAPNWMYSFEENEGYDTDHDSASDYEELQGKFRGKTDPQDADSPRRRSAMYFPGRNAALQSMPFVKEAYPRAAMGYPDDMSFLQYTVECWVRPESTADATVLERTSFTDPSHCKDQRYVRRNFAIMVRNGRWCTAFDSSGTLDGSVVEALGRTAVEVGKWTHVAATYDANRLTLYVDGSEDGYALSSLKPEYGASAVVVYPAGSGASTTNDESSGMSLEALGGTAHAYWFDSEYSQHAFLIGASFANASDGRHLDVTQGQGWRRYKDFFKGYVDEIRVWDGARNSGDISADMKRRYSREDAIVSRNAFYDEWATAKRRYMKDGNGKDQDVVPELRFHWTFDSIPGAENAAVVAQAPHGFLEGAKPLYSRPAGYEIPWWSGIVGAYGSVYEGKRNWVPWIPNTVAHLPRFDGSTLDSAYWSEDFAGDEAGVYRFARTAEPVSKWTQYVRNMTERSSEFRTSGRRFWLSYNSGTNLTSALPTLFEFTGRHLNQTGDDLLPLGGAFVKYVDEMWDEQGASTPWEQTGIDADNDGLPDWWQEYAEQNYRKDVPAGEDITWDTLIWYGVGGAQMRIRAGDAYRRDLAKGTYVDANGEVRVGPTKYAQTADEDADGVPDWWSDLYGIRGESGLADHDNDGLPNYVEYLLSEVFDFKIAFNPTVPDSVRKGVSDYFYKIGELYAGEIFTDHDLVDDLWEDIYPETFASRRVYDAFKDADNDGWSLRSECRYSKAVMPIVADQVSHYSAADGLTADYPIPTIELTLHYKGAKSDAVEKAPIVVQMTTERKLESAFEAVFRIAGTADGTAGEGQTASTGRSSKDGGTDATTAFTRSLGKWSDRHALGTLTPGYINQNSVKLEFCYDPSVEVYSWMVTTAVGIVDKRGTRAEFDTDKRKYGDANVTLMSRDTEYRELIDVRLRTDEGSKTAFWENVSSGERFGTLDLVSGAFDIDFGVFKGQYVVNGTNAADYASLEDQTYRIAYSVNPPVGLPRKLYLGEATTGHVREGRNTIIAFADLDGNGAYTAGEPYGCVTDVDVSWKGTAASIELTENSAVCPRMNIADGTSDREFTWGVESGYWTNHVAGVLNGGTKTRVRIVRGLYRGLASSETYDIMELKKAFSQVPPDDQLNRVVLDKYMDLSVNPLITEADFFAAGELDIDWSTLVSDIPDSVMYGNSLGDGEIVKFYYRIILGDGTIDPYSLNNLHNIFFGRVFDTTAGREQNPPICIAPGPTAESIVTESSPTFRWELPGMNTASTVCSYPAFRIVVTEQANPGTVVYDSGIQRTPALERENDKYVYEWKAPLYVGDRTLQNKVFENNRAYSWKVSMYNCKFKSDCFSAAGNFYVNVATNGYDRGNIDVSVRYFGPTNACLDKFVRVRAYTSPDFTGTPVAGASLDLGVAANRASLTNCAANCRIVGLPKGSYYLQAFIDSNTNGVCDAWESMGYLCPRDGSTPDSLNPAAITFAGEIGDGNTAVIYIEDSDTDGDGLPDAWEYAQYGSLAARGAEQLSETAAGEFVINSDWAASIKLQTGAKAPSAGLAGRIGSTLRNAGVLALSMGAPTAGYDSFSAAISGFVSPELVKDGVRITGLDIADGTVSIKVEAETASAAAAWIEGRKTLEVLCQVKWKSSLSDSVWTNLGEPILITVGAEAAEIDIGGHAPAGNSGFYSVDVYKK